MTGDDPRVRLRLELISLQLRLSILDALRSTSADFIGWPRLRSGNEFAKVPSTSSYGCVDSEGDAITGGHACDAEVILHTLVLVPFSYHCDVLYLCIFGVNVACLSDSAPGL